MKNKNFTHPDWSARKGGQMGVSVKNKNFTHPDWSARKGGQMGVSVKYKISHRKNAKGGMGD